MKTTDSVMREKNRQIGAEVIRIARKFGINEIDLAGELGTLSQLNKDLASHSLAEARREWVEETMKVVDRHTAWKPTIGFGSDEEKGFQKGLIAEANLLKKDLTDLLTGDNPSK